MRRRRPLTIEEHTHRLRLERLWNDAQREKLRNRPYPFRRLYPMTSEEQAQLLAALIKNETSP